MGPSTSAPAQASNGQSGQAPLPPQSPPFTPPHHTPPPFPSFANSTPSGYTPPASPFPPPSPVPAPVNYQMSTAPSPDPPLPPMFEFASDFPDTPETPESSPRRINAWMVVAGLVVLVLVSVGLLQWQRSRVPSGSSAGVTTRTSPSSLGLSVERVGNDLRVSWNRNDANVARAQAAILVIHDGSNPQQDILLDGNQLRNGSVLYSPVSGYVQFRLEMLGAGTQTASESVLAISGRQRAPEAAAIPPSTPAPSNVERAARRTPEPQSRVSTPPPAPVSARLSTPAPPVSTPVQPPVSNPVSALPSPTVAKQSAPPAERLREPKRIFVPPASAPGTQQVRVVMVDPPPSQRAGQTQASSPLAGNVSFAAPPPAPAPPAAVSTPEAKPQVTEAKPQVNEAKPQVAEAKPQVNESKPLISETRIQPPEVKPQAIESKPQPTQTTAPLVIAPPVAEPSTSAAYVPPRPLVQTQPALPREIRSMLFGEATVDVKVKTDPTGKVTGVEAVSKPGPLRPFLERAALDAARLWRFTPARMGDRAVAGETVVQFTFRSAQGK